MNITKNLGMLLLAIYLILIGITMLVHLAIPAIVMGISSSIGFFANRVPSTVFVMHFSR